MVGRAWTLTAFVLLLAFAPFGPAMAEDRGGGYVVFAGVTIWCAAASHNLAPIGNPEDYSSPLGWLFSGEPECAFADAMNAAAAANGEEREEWGIGGFAWSVAPSDFFEPVTLRTVDEAFGPDATWISSSVQVGEFTLSAQGCGPQTLTPEDPGEYEHHWQSSPSNPINLMWAFIEVIGIEDDLTVCFGSAGSIVASFAD